MCVFALQKKGMLFWMLKRDTGKKSGLSSRRLGREVVSETVFHFAFPLIIHPEGGLFRPLGASGKTGSLFLANRTHVLWFDQPGDRAVLCQDVAAMAQERNTTCEPELGTSYPTGFPGAPL